MDEIKKKVNGCINAYICQYYHKENMKECKYYIESSDDECSFITKENKMVYCDNDIANYKALQEEINSFFKAFHGLTSHNINMAKKVLFIALLKNDKER